MTPNPINDGLILVERLCQTVLFMLLKISPSYIKGDNDNQNSS